jgi:adenylate cyclase
MRGLDLFDATRCDTEIKSTMAERNASIPKGRRVEFRIGINVGDIVIDDGDIYGDGVNIAARLESIAQPGGIYLSDDAYRQVRDKLDLNFQDFGEQELKNIARPVRVYRLTPPTSDLALPDKPSIAVLPFQNMSGDPEQEYFTDGMVEDIITGLSRVKWLFVVARNSTFTYKDRSDRCETNRPRTWRALCARRQRAQGSGSRAYYWTAHRCRVWSARLG